MELTTQVTPVTDPNVQAINNTMATLNNLPQILQSHQLRTSKAIQIGQKILDEIANLPDGKLTPALFEKTKAYIIKCREVLEEIENQRKPYTQAADLIRKMFIELEALIDIKNKESLAYQMQQGNNNYVREQELERQRQQEEADRKAKKGIEEGSIRANFQNQIAQCLISYIGNKREVVQNAFNAITLEVFDEKAKGIRAMQTAFPADKLNSIIKIAAPPVVYHNTDEVNVLLQDEWQKYDFESFKSDYDRQIQDLKTQLIASLPAKKTELENIAAAGKKQKEILLQQQKEREDQQKREQEALLEKEKQEAIEKAKQFEQASNIQTLFEAQPIITTPAAASKSTIVLTVKNHAGIAEVFTLWFQIFATKMTVEEIMNRKPSQMAADLAKEAMKHDGKRIGGNNVEYTTETVSVNRKAKSEKA